MTKDKNNYTFGTVSFSNLLEDSFANESYLGPIRVLSIINIVLFHMLLKQFLEGVYSRNSSENSRLQFLGFDIFLGL